MQKLSAAELSYKTMKKLRAQLVAWRAVGLKSAWLRVPLARAALLSDAQLESALLRLGSQSQTQERRVRAALLVEVEGGRAERAAAAGGPAVRRRHERRRRMGRDGAPGGRAAGPRAAGPRTEYFASAVRFRAIFCSSISARCSNVTRLAGSS